MNIKNLKETLPILMRNNIVPFIWGYQGIGKTQVVKQVADSIGGGFVHLHLATMVDPGDLIGLLVSNGDGTVSHIPPKWFPTEGSGIIFLDECNRASNELIQSCFSFITSKTIHTHKLPDGWKIVAAGNYETDEFITTNTQDAAWLSRFCHIDLKPEVAEFVSYAESVGNEMVASFISTYPNLLQSSNRQTFKVNVTPEPRAWNDMIGRLDKEQLGDNTWEVYSGIVGDIAASCYINFKDSAFDKIDYKTILNNYSKIKNKINEITNDRSNTRYDMLNQPLEIIAVKLEDGSLKLNNRTIKNLKEFLLMIPLELVSKFVKQISKFNFSGKNELLDDIEFVNSLTKKVK